MGRIASTSTNADALTGLPNTYVSSAELPAAPSDIEQARFALGSCRKTHTPGPDALALLDDLLSANVSSPPARPQILVLGGDQIYADEVTETLLMMLTDAGLTLLGPEELPLSSDVSTSPVMLPASTRTKTMKQSGFAAPRWRIVRASAGTVTPKDPSVTTWSD